MSCIIWSTVEVRDGERSAAKEGIVEDGLRRRWLG